VSDYVAANRAHWDERVPIHFGSRFYDVERWLEERPLPRAWEQEMFGDVAGLDVVHLQCHFGLDTLSLALAGARVTGLDFSGAAIEVARSIASRAELTDQVRFVEADVLEAAAALAPNQYDLVYVSLGALCWLPDVDAWARQVAALLRVGGRLFLHDVHPLSGALADDELQIAHTYFEEPEPYVDDTGETYTDGASLLQHTRNYSWNHSIGEIVNAVAHYGLRIVDLTEHDWTAWPRFQWLVRTGDQRWETPPDRVRVPLSFMLLASKPG
jgi:SAM-dependent methyltransferase